MCDAGTLARVTVSNCAGRKRPCEKYVLKVRYRVR
jgi:hypothetical protein